MAHNVNSNTEEAKAHRSLQFLRQTELQFSETMSQLHPQKEKNPEPTSELCTRKTPRDKQLAEGQHENTINKSQINMTHPKPRYPTTAIPGYPNTIKAQ